MGFDNLATRCLSSRGNSFHVFPMVEVRQNLRRKLPYDFEDPVHAYPEACQPASVCGCAVCSMSINLSLGTFQLHVSMHVIT
jgi:hypothetical protein